MSAVVVTVALGRAAPPAARAAATWAPTGALTTPRGNHTAMLLSKGEVLVAGGRNVTVDTFGALAGAELYDPASGRWTPAGSLTEARFWAHRDVAARRPGAGVRGVQRQNRPGRCGAL